MPSRQQVLSGSVALQVNGGPSEVCREFLAADKAGQVMDSETPCVSSVPFPRKAQFDPLRSHPAVLGHACLSSPLAVTLIACCVVFCLLTFDSCSTPQFPPEDVAELRRQLRCFFHACGVAVNVARRLCPPEVNVMHEYVQTEAVSLSKH